MFGHKLNGYDGDVPVNATPYPLFRRTLRAMRMKRGWTQEQLAERARCDYKYLQLVELGKTGVSSLDLVERLARALGTKPWVLLCDNRDWILRFSGIEAVNLLRVPARPGRPPTRRN